MTRTTGDMRMVRTLAMGIVAIGVLTISLHAQAPDTLWTKTFGGGGSDQGYSVQQTTDGGFIITGWTSSFGAGSYDVWLIRTDALGDTLWTRTYGGTGWDRGYSVQQTTDGGYIITGGTTPYGAGFADVWLLRTDAQGDTLWTKTFGGADSDVGSSVQQTTDGGFIITGRTGSFGAGSWDVWLLRTDAQGDTLWTRTFGGTLGDVGRSVQQTTDGGFIITGHTLSFGAGNWDVWLIKTDSLGNTQWTRTITSRETEWDYGYSVRQTTDGGYIITGATTIPGVDGWYLWLIKTDSLGHTQWTRTFGGTGNDWGRSVQQTTDGGYIVTGGTQSFGAGSWDVWLIRTDSLGDTLWTRIFGGTADDRGHSVQQTSDGGYIIAGSTGSFGAGGADVWLIKIESDVGVEEEDNYELRIMDYELTVYPNPFREETVISYKLQVTSDKSNKKLVTNNSSLVTISIYDIAGRLVRTLVDGTVKAGHHTVRFDGRNLASGVYFARLTVGEFKETRKITLLQ